MKNSIKLVTLLLTAGFYSACTRQLPPDTRSRIPLEGNWGLQLDTAGAGIAPDWLTKSCTDSLFLPGTTDMGKKGTYNTDMTLTTSLSREYVFEGKALYTKQVRYTGRMGWNIRPPGNGTHEAHDDLDRWKRSWGK